MRKLLILFMLGAQFAFGQEQNVSLETCYQLARANYPKLNDAAKQNQIAVLRKQNIDVSWNPTVILQGQASYQSDVTKLGVELPGVSVEEQANDQYKFYLDIKQNIYDGGASRSIKSLKDAEKDVSLKSLEVELFSLRDEVNNSFFAAILIHKSQKILGLKRKLLEERLKIARSGFENGMIGPRDVETLQAELIITRQQARVLEANEQAALQALSLLTGMKIGDAEQLLRPELSVVSENVSRPEYAWFNALGNQLERQADLLQNYRSPKMFGFGQAGYGRPALNALNRDFEPYYLVGFGLSWNVLDWRQTHREKQVLQLKNQLIHSQEQLFTRHIDIALSREMENLAKMRDLLQSDTELIEIRKRVTSFGASQLAEGVITSVEYLADLNAEIQARINQQTHQSEYLQTIAKINTLNGK